MTTLRTSVCLRCFGAALAVLALAGCTTSELTDKPTSWLRSAITTGKWKPIPRARNNEVEVVTIEHVVDFSSGETSIAPTTMRELRSFLGRSNVNGADRVTLHGPRRDLGSHDPVTRKRLEVLQSELAELGVVSSVPSGERLQPADGEAVAILVTRAVVIAPDCAQPKPTRGYRPGWVVGCADSVNFGQMVFDPLDLREGRGMDPADGEARALAIQRYREGEITPLDESAIDTTDAQ